MKRQAIVTLVIVLLGVGGISWADELAAPSIDSTLQATTPNVEPAAVSGDESILATPNPESSVSDPIDTDASPPSPTTQLQLEEQLGIGYRGRSPGIKLKYRSDSEYNIGFFYDSVSATTRRFQLLIEVRHVQPFWGGLFLKYGTMFSYDQSTVAADAATIARLGPSLGLERHWADWISSEINASPLVLRVENGFHIDAVRVSMSVYLHLFEKWKEVPITPYSGPTLLELKKLEND